MNLPPISPETFDEVMIPVYAPSSFILDKALGSRIWDMQGREYIDFSGGIAVTALGHSHPELLRVLYEQAAKVWHTSNTFINEPALRLAKKLVNATFADKVFFTNSGAEANEAALKLARRVAYDRSGTQKNEIISCTQSFHGRTLFTVTVGGQPKYTEGFGPLPGGITHIPFNNIEAARAAISNRTCAVIVEPVQGEGGVFPARAEFLHTLRQQCDQHHALLIFDEVQTGIGRTGSLYAYMEYGVQPDILSTAKALGNGFPIGAMLTTQTLAQHFSIGAHGSTYGGNPLATAIADKVIDLVNDPSLLAGVKRKHHQIVEGLKEIQAKYGIFKEIRGMGLLIGAELTAPFRGQVKEFITLAVQQGLVLLNAGPDVLRFAPSLLIPEKDIDEGLACLSRITAQISQAAT